MFFSIFEKNVFYQYRAIFINTGLSNKGCNFLKTSLLRLFVFLLNKFRLVAFESLIPFGQPCLLKSNIIILNVYRDRIL